MPVKPISYLLAGDRFFLLTVLRKRGIPTINLNIARSVKAALRIVEQGSYPLILRIPDKATGVVVKNKLEAKSIIDALAHLDQYIVIEEVTKDIVSSYVAFPEVVASVKKKTKSTDVLFGPGELRNHRMGMEAEQLALDVASTMDTQIARVDISLNGSPRVINVELCPGLIDPSKVAGINIPKKIIELLKQNYTSYTEKPMLLKFFEDAKSVMRDVLKSKQL
jgi:glutathione synthase/RimK-type ligase-like ATP-grasp enzyme